MVTLETLQKYNQIQNQSKSELLEYRISTDTRKIEDGDLFIALDGANFKGHKFCEQALEKGAAGVVFHGDEKLFSELSTKYPSAYIVRVDDTLKFLQASGAAHIRAWQDQGGLVIGITGSNGKTTHKEMLNFLLTDLFGDEVIATKGNLNNHIGVPLTLVSVKNHHKVAIVEMGTNHPGEIEVLCNLANPDCGFITNIGESHLEFLIDKDGVFKEKSELYHYIKNKKGTFVANINDPYLAKLEQYDGFVSVGKSGKVQTLSNYPHSFHFNCGKDIELRNKNLHGEHNYYNLTVCFTLSAQLFPNHVDKLLEALTQVIFAI